MERWKLFLYYNSEKQECETCTDIYFVVKTNEVKIKKDWIRDKSDNGFFIFIFRIN
jgi:hypothetical protein